MKNKTLYLSWGAVYILCLALSFIPAPAGVLKAALSILSLLFFVPGALLLIRGFREKNQALIKQIRFISALSLVLTLVLLIANLLSIAGSAVLGSVLHIFLLVVSVPMPISGFWVVSVFLWACLFVGSFLKKP